MGASANSGGLEAIAVRRAKIIDAEKVRYRVYSTPTEFVAVIAESALMAVKVAGISEPYRIVRDLPTSGVTTESEKMAKSETLEQVSLATAPKQNKNQLKIEIKLPSPNAQNERFTPMHLRDLSKKAPLQDLVVSHTVLNQIIEEMQKKKAEQAPPPPPAPPPAPKVEAAAPAPLPSEVKEEVPPPPPPVAAAPAPEKTSEEVLSPEEVDKLLKS